MLFKLTDEEFDKVYDWTKDHKCDDDLIATIGGKYSYVFIPTGLGMIKRVECICGDVLDLTDVDKW